MPGSSLSRLYSSFDFQVISYAAVCQFVSQSHAFPSQLHLARWSTLTADVSLPSRAVIVWRIVGTGETDPICPPRSYPRGQFNWLINWSLSRFWPTMLAPITLARCVVWEPVADWVVHSLGQPGNEIPLRATRPIINCLEPENLD